MIKLAQATPRPPAAADMVVHTIAFAAVCELPVMCSVLFVIVGCVQARWQGVDGVRRCGGGQGPEYHGI